MTVAGIRGGGVIPVEGTYNLREVGGYRVGDRMLRWGKLFRSDALHDLTDGGRRTLAELGIGLVVDLRSEDESLAAPSRLGEGVEVVHEPIFTSSRPATVPASATLASVYDHMVDHTGDRLAAAVGRIAASGDGAVLVHCTAGKDRTGLVVALTLLAIGVDRAEVVADYSATAGYLAGPWADRMLEQMRSAGVEISPEIEELVTASPAAALDRVIDRWEGEWGSASGYLLAQGLTPDQLAALSDALLRPAPVTAHQEMS